VDLDLLRDSHLMSEAWRCRQCGHSYDKSQIERTLLEIVQKYSLAYQIQDLACERCRLVKAENLPEVCPKCAGRFVCKEPQSEFNARYYPHFPINPFVNAFLLNVESLFRLKTFANIAKFHKFERLAELTTWLSH